MLEHTNLKPDVGILGSCGSITDFAASGGCNWNKEAEICSASGMFWFSDGKHTNVYAPCEWREGECTYAAERACGITFHVGICSGFTGVDTVNEMCFEEIWGKYCPHTANFTDARQAMNYDALELEAATLAESWEEDELYECYGERIDVYIPGTKYSPWNSDTYPRPSEQREAFAAAQAAAEATTLLTRQ